MSRPYHKLTVILLSALVGKDRALIKDLHQQYAPKLPNKDFYNYIFRLHQQGLVAKVDNKASITEEGKKLLLRLCPEKDSVWKMVIFDIPEKHKYVRNVLRSKLRQLHFKKWQNSIWISPFVLDREIEEELTALGKKYFVRLIKTSEINHIQDLEKMFE
jgi:DNA-binding transcriptional regulator PaaX